MINHLHIKILNSYLLLFLFSFSLNSAKSQLVINEVSQGPQGSKEYVELLVTGTFNCDSSNCVDLRGWYIDDNNGSFSTGSSSSGGD